ncbi:MAG TPA: P-II family nitrogen regulator [Planctomycetaceae bacterium]|nr:P-II family nitrogen regulator [Planctomycetaceae bacterium]HIQ23034.1 P-II family nitrogen regulator [Planctomycetota bacterium]
MKEIKAIIQPFMLTRVLEGLREVEGLPAVTVSEVRGYSVVDPDYEPRVKTKLEVMVPDTLVEPVVEVIQRHAHTGRRGDGRIFVIAIDQTVKIRTGERDTAT